MNQSRSHTTDGGSVLYTTRLATLDIRTASRGRPRNLDSRRDDRAHFQVKFCMYIVFYNGPNVAGGAHRLTNHSLPRSTYINDKAPRVSYTVVYDASERWLLGPQKRVDEDFSGVVCNAQQLVLRKVVKCLQSPSKIHTSMSTSNQGRLRCCPYDDASW